MDSESRPNFIKPFIPETTSNRLRIPLSFMTDIQHENSQIFFLKGPSRNIWTVKLILDVDDDEYFFQEGWSDFVKDHALKFEDICVFIYEGNLYFTVQILDETECQKESAFHAICIQDSTCSKRDKGKKVFESSHCGSKRKTNMEANVTSSRVDSGSRTRISRRPQVSEVKDIEKSRALKAANAFVSNNPFAVIAMQPSYVFLLPMPQSFKNSHLPKANKEEMILIDPNGKSWLVVYNLNNKVGWLSRRGWRAFVNHNNVEEGDVCIFELIEENKMQVHIFRAVRR